MRLVAPLVLVGLLGGCATAPPPAEPPLPPGHAACREEARNAPEVRALASQLNPTSFANQDRVSTDMRVAQLAAFRDCLRRNGLASPGGVEAPRQR